MFRSNAFRQQAQNWQQQFRQVQSAGFLQRIFAWILLGLVMMLSLALLVVVVLLSWILIPLMLYRAQKQMRKAQQADNQHQQFSQRSSRQSRHETHIIEGEIISRKED
ncbi:hypothetical protein [Methylophaga nitratireducenticrescens]|uniref:Uncharacterized protein n=1 Tax=Methylophaga nitratireducenticrescens TaxID=754476 RepID=I1XMG6_METNJ|nr:hypothetical protein [Methylophaga nitratireducenticrescens]AFI85585.1 hypothetical protein Q7A_2803 [Methylophaga nitratireducenticrescens]AUZ85320.1 hypothetical protein CDW43_12415 [Methylophaga nitratireducenticrescens]